MTDVRIVINATSRDGPRALPVLLESLRLACVPRHAVTIVCPDDLPEDLQAVRAEHDLGAATALAHAVDAEEAWVMCLHEAMVVGESFLGRLAALADAAAGLNCVSLSRDDAVAGLYSVAWLRTQDISAETVADAGVAARCDPAMRRFVTADVRDMGEFRYSDDDRVRRIRWHPEIDVYDLEK